MDEVAELVEQRDDLVVLQQTTVEVAREHALGELHPGDTTHEVELRSVLVLAVARMEVEMDPPDPFALERDVVGGDLVVPGVAVRHGRPLETEEAPGDVEEPLPNGLEREVRPDLLGVDGQLLLADELGVVREVGAVDVVRVRSVARIRSRSTACPAGRCRRRPR